MERIPAGRVLNRKERFPNGPFTLNYCSINYYNSPNGRELLVKISAWYLRWTINRSIDGWRLEIDGILLEMVSRSTKYFFR